MSYIAQLKGICYVVSEMYNSMHSHIVIHFLPNLVLPLATNSLISQWCQQGKVGQTGCHAQDMKSAPKSFQTAADAASQGSKTHWWTCNLSCSAYMSTQMITIGLCCSDRQERELAIPSHSDSTVNFAVVPLVAN